MSENLALQRGGNFCLSKVTLAIGSTVTKLTSTSTFNFVIDGRHYTHAALSNNSAAVAITKPDGTTDVGTFTGSAEASGGSARGSSRIYGVFVNAAGDISVIPGPVVTGAALLDGRAPLEWPAPQRGKAIIGAVRIDATSGTVFTPNVTAFDAAGITDTYYDLFSHPTEPIRS